MPIYFCAHLLLRPDSVGEKENMGMSIVEALILKVFRASRKDTPTIVKCTNFHHESMLYICNPVFPMQKKADKKRLSRRWGEGTKVSAYNMATTCKTNSADGTTHMTSLRVEVSISANWVWTLKTSVTPALVIFSSRYPLIQWQRKNLTLLRAGSGA